MKTLGESVGLPRRVIQDINMTGCYFRLSLTRSPSVCYSAWVRWIKDVFPSLGFWFQSLSVARRKEGNTDFPQWVLAAFPPRDVRGWPTDPASLRHRPPHTPHDAAAFQFCHLFVLRRGGYAGWRRCWEGCDLASVPAWDGSTFKTTAPGILTLQSWWWWWWYFLMTRVWPTRWHFGSDTYGWLGSRHPLTHFVRIHV